MSGPPIRVLIADDHPPTRLGIRRTLEDFGMEVVAEVGDAALAVSAALEHVPDLCLFDIRMPGGGGIKATAEVVAAVPTTHVVILTVSRDDDDLFAALKAGAVGYLLKDMDPGRLGEALGGVLRGEAAIPRDLVGRLVSDYRGRGDKTVRGADGRIVKLSGREYDILCMLADGLSTADIAARLFVAPVTIRTHISAALKKLGAPDREAAIKLLRDQ